MFRSIEDEKEIRKEIHCRTQKDTKGERSEKESGILRAFSDIPALRTQNLTLALIGEHETLLQMPVMKACIHQGAWRSEEQVAILPKEARAPTSVDAFTNAVTQPRSSFR